MTLRIRPDFTQTATYFIMLQVNKVVNDKDHMEMDYHTKLYYRRCLSHYKYTMHRVFEMQASQVSKQ